MTTLPNPLPSLPPLPPLASLPLPGTITINIDEVKTVFDLIRSATTRKVVRDFLEAKKLKFSAANWDELYHSRILPAIKDGDLTLKDLHGLLRSTEGYGNQHVFLFRCDPARAKAMIATERIRVKLLELDMQHLSQGPLAVDIPDEPKIVDVHTGSKNGLQFLLIKEIEKRTRNVLDGTVVDSQTGGFAKHYKPEAYRVVNIARLFENGILELRIASRDSATKYAADVLRLRNAVADFVLIDEFFDYSIQKAKDYILEKHDELKDKIRYSDYTLTNRYGTQIKAIAAMATEDFTDDVDALESLNSFKKSQTSCTSSNIFFLATDDEKRAKDIHVLLSGETNEFALTAAATAEDYEYVFSEILQYNQ